MTDLQLSSTRLKVLNELSPSRDAQIHKLNRSTEASRARLDPLKDSRDSSTSNEATNPLIRPAHPNKYSTRQRNRRNQFPAAHLHRSDELVKIAFLK